MRILWTLLVAALLLAPAHAAARVGKAAPDFQGQASDGSTVRLSDLRGSYVVLEWINHECPFVQGQYGPGKMQALQRKYTGKGVKWISVCSSAPGKQGHRTADQWMAVTREKKAAPTSIVLDESGKIGRLYGASTTPHMFVIDPQGKVIYAGAIDDRGKTNYVDQALTEAMAGKPVSVSNTQPYGCSVKYR